MNEQTAWINGEFLPFHDAGLSLADSGVVHGDSVTEMFRTFRHQPFRVAEHLVRFRHSLTAALLECSYTDEELTAVIAQVIQRASIDLAEKRDLGVILFATGGPNMTYVGSEYDRSPTICVHSFPLQTDLWKRLMRDGQSLVVSAHPAIPISSFDPSIKSRSRMHWRIADREVRRSHPQSTAVFADQKGNLTETSSGNLFAVINDAIITPPADVVLNGISREVVIELAEERGWSVHQEPLSIDRALTASELWTSSTPYCLAPVTEFNGQPIGNGTPGPRYLEVIEAWSQLVGVDFRQQILADD